MILIYLIQRKVKKIVNQDQDQVFEEYELLYNVNILNTNKNADNLKKNINWEVTPDELNSICPDLNFNHPETAKYLMKRI